MTIRYIGNLIFSMAFCLFAVFVSFTYSQELQKQEELVTGEKFE